MLPAANSSVRTSDSPRGLAVRASFVEALPSSCSSHEGMHHGLSAFAVMQLLSFLMGALLLIALDGCSSSSPRFRKSGASADAAARDDDEVRFATKIRDEEAREDDRRVDVQKIRKKYADAHANGTAYYSNTTPGGFNRDRFLLDVVSFLGVPYAYGGSTKQGIDCSGFTARVYQSAMNTPLPRTARGQFEIGEDVEKDSLQFGDLVFFNTTGSSPSHVGIYIEDDLFAHASVVNGVTFSSLESTYYRNRFVGARRVVR